MPRRLRLNAALIGLIAALSVQVSEAKSETFAVLANPYSGQVLGVVMPKGAKVSTRTVARCGPGCEFIDILERGQCAYVSVSKADGGWGYAVGARNRAAFNQDMSMRFCREYGARCTYAGRVCN